MNERVWSELESRMAELRDLGSIAGLLSWDQETCMPSGGAAGRARQLAAIHSLIHERIIDPALGDFLMEAAADPDLDERRRAMVRNLGRERSRAVRIPARLVRAIAEEQSAGVEAWRAARGERKFSIFAPRLARLVELRREQADAIGHEGERYDALLDGYEPGMRIARLEPIFDRLRGELIPILERLTEARAPKRWEHERHRFPSDRQWEFTLHLLEQMGFDFERGRQDRSTHPFTSASGRGDVRLTTRIAEDNVFSAIFGTIHEGGHGLYEQHLPAEHMLDAIGEAASMGLHESQSRLWENLIGRSLPFWQLQFPHLRDAFPEALAGVGAEEVYAAVNQVSRSRIRVEADEVTYNLHIILRFQLELAMLRGELSVGDVPAAWNELTEELIGVRPEDDREGVLQDIHWAWAEFGYFPTYALGNLYSAILHERIGQDLGSLDEVIRAGELVRIRDWLAEKIHRVGHLWDAEEIVERATGSNLTTEPFLRYLKTKYQALYGVEMP